MSDGEKAALYLAGRALGADLGSVVLVDEPETHFHSLLAVQFWDAIERERPDLRFIYVTHDMTFAASRSAVRYLLANPKTGLTPIKLHSDVADLATVLLGTASLSFYANKVVFCEGEADSLDAGLYKAWYQEKETVVQAVGSCDMVLRSVSALDSSQLVQNLKVHGIVDRDFYADDRLETLPVGVAPLGVHEIETLFALPGVAAAVAKHLDVGFDKTTYEQALIAKYDDGDRHKVVIERWKARVERLLGNIVSTVSTKSDSLNDISVSIPDTFDQSNWPFSPQQLLEEETRRVEGLFTATPPDLEGILRIMPGKKLQPVAPALDGVKPSTFDQLIINAVRGQSPSLEQLGIELRVALAPYMPTAA